MSLGSTNFFTDDVDTDRLAKLTKVVPSYRIDSREHVYGLLRELYDNKFKGVKVPREEDLIMAEGLLVRLVSYQDLFVKMLFATFTNVDRYTRLNNLRDERLASKDYFKVLTPFLELVREVRNNVVHEVYGTRIQHCNNIKRALSMLCATPIRAREPRGVEMLETCFQSILEDVLVSIAIDTGYTERLKTILNKKR